MTWGATPTINVVREGFIPAAPFSGDLGAVCPSPGPACIPQPGTTVKVDALPNRPMFRLAYRNYGGHQALTFTHTVDGDGWTAQESAGMSCGRRPGTGESRISTFAPADGLYRWMGASAMDRDGNLAVGYSIGNGTAPNYPGVAYAGRLATDPPNELSQGEAMLHAGSGSQTGTARRWGDYSMMTTDPVDDCTFWYTQEYIRDRARSRGERASEASSSRPVVLCHHHHHLRLQFHRHRHRHLRQSSAPAAATTATAATAASIGALPGAEGDRADAGPRQGTDPQRELLGRPRAPCTSRRARPLSARARGPGAIRRRGFRVNLVVGRR